jgi:biopolymer transport protein ExbD
VLSFPEETLEPWTARSLLLRLRIEATAETSVRINADQDVTVGLLVRVADEVKRSGCSGFSLVTARKAGG